MMSASATECGCDKGPTMMADRHLSNFLLFCESRYRMSLSKFSCRGSSRGACIRHRALRRGLKSSAQKSC
jgi:hypothetical protein